MPTRSGGARLDSGGPGPCAQRRTSGEMRHEDVWRAIDALAADNPGSPLFEWDARGAARRWKAFDLEIATDSTACPQLRLRVRNK